MCYVIDIYYLFDFFIFVKDWIKKFITYTKIVWYYLHISLKIQNSLNNHI